MGLSKGTSLRFLSIPESSNILESLWQSLLLAEVVRDFAALKLALLSKPSCLKLSIPLIAIIATQVGILIKALGSGGMP